MLMWRKEDRFDLWWCLYLVVVHLATLNVEIFRSKILNAFHILRSRNINKIKK